MNVQVMSTEELQNVIHEIKRVKRTNVILYNL